MSSTFSRKLLLFFQVDRRKIRSSRKIEHRTDSFRHQKKSIFSNVSSRRTTHRFFINVNESMSLRLMSRVLLKEVRFSIDKLCQSVLERDSPMKIPKGKRASFV